MKMMMCLILALASSFAFAFEVEYASFSDQTGEKKVTYRLFSEQKGTMQKFFMSVTSGKKRSHFSVSEDGFHSALNRLNFLYGSELMTQKRGVEGKPCGKALRMKAQIGSYISVSLCRDNYRHLALEAKTKALLELLKKKPMVAQR